MSKNNQQEMQRKMTPQRQRFGIRKLSVGVASVLLGTTFLIGGGTVAHASDDGNTVQNTPSTEQQVNNGELQENQGKTVTPNSTHSESTTTVSSDLNANKQKTTFADQTDSDKQSAKENGTESTSDHQNAELTNGNHQEENNSSKKTQDQKSKSVTFYGQISDRSKNPAGFNDNGINPATGKPYPVKLSDLEHDFIFKRTIVMHNGDQVSTFVEGLDGKAYDPSTDTKSGMYYRDATVDADGNVKYSQWKRLGNNGVYEFASDLKFPEYKLNTEMQDASGSVVTSVAAANAEEAENSTVNLYFHKVKIDITYKDTKGNTITNTVSEPFKQVSDNTYEYEGSSSALLNDKNKIANDLLTLTSNETGVFPQFNSLSIDGTNYDKQDAAKSALAYALSDYRNHNIQVNVSYKYQLKINLYDETSGKLITIPASDANAKYFTTENGHSIYSFQVTPNTYVVNLAQLYNYTMTDASWKTWTANFEKHSNGYWYTKTDMDKPLTLTLNYRSNGTYSFVGTMRDTDGNLIPADYTKSLGNMYKNGAYEYAKIKPGSYINDLTKFKLDNSYEYDYYLTADSLTQWEKYFEKHSNGYWYAKDDLNTNVALNLTYDKVQKRNIKLTLVDVDTGDAIKNYAEKTTANGRGFDAHMDGNVYSDYGTKAGFAEFLLHMPGYEITADSKAKLDAFLAKPYVNEDFIGTLDYKKLAPIHVVAKDSDGNTLFKYDITTQNAQAGNPYEVNVLNIPGYKFVKDENNNGEVSTTAPTVTFTYEKDSNSNEGTWIKDYDILKPGIMLPDHVGTIDVPNGKYDIRFDDAQKENIKYYEEHGYTFLGGANAFKLGQQWYPLSWIKATLVPNQGVTVHYYGINDDKSETQLQDDDYLAENRNNPDYTDTNNGIDENKFYYPEGQYTAKPGVFPGWHLYGIRDSKGNVTKIDYDKIYGDKLNNPAMVLAALTGDVNEPNGTVHGEYLSFAQDITYLYVKGDNVEFTQHAKSRHIIDYKYGNGDKQGQTANPDFSEDIDWTREVEVNANTGDIISVGKWTAKDNKTFQDVTSPSAEDSRYTNVDKPKVSGPTTETNKLVPDNENNPLTYYDHVLYYLSNPVTPTDPNKPDKPTDPSKPDNPAPDKPTDPSKPDNPTPDTPTDPNKPDTPTPDNPDHPNKPDNPTPDTPVEPNKPDQPTNSEPDQPAQPGKPGAPEPEQPGQPGQPTTSTQPQEKTTTPSVTVEPGRAQANQLPQTGNTSNRAASLGLVGLVGALFAGIGFGKKRRRN